VRTYANLREPTRTYANLPRLDVFESRETTDKFPGGDL